MDMRMLANAEQCLTHCRVSGATFTRWIGTVFAGVATSPPRHTHHRLATQVSIETKGQKAAAAAWLLLLLGTLHWLVASARGGAQENHFQCSVLSSAVSTVTSSIRPLLATWQLGPQTLTMTMIRKICILQYNYKIIFMFSSVIMCMV